VPAQLIVDALWKTPYPSDNGEALFICKEAGYQVIVPAKLSELSTWSTVSANEQENQFF
jgi:hypothetical protein